MAAEEEAGAAEAVAAEDCGVVASEEVEEAVVEAGEAAAAVAVDLRRSLTNNLMPHSETLYYDGRPAEM